MEKEKSYWFEKIEVMNIDELANAIIETRNKINEATEKLNTDDFRKYVVNSLVLFLYIQKYIYAKTLLNNKITRQMIDSLLKKEE